MDFEHIRTASDSDFVTRSVEVLALRIRQNIDEFGSAIIGLSGGSTPRPIYEALGNEDIDWSAVSVFLVDERYTEETSDDSNLKMIVDTLVKTSGMSEDNIYAPDTRLPMDICLEEYEAELAGLLSQGIPHIVTLGLGEDGHIASLFPPVPDAAFGDRLVLHTTTNTFAVHDRISTTMVVIGSADRKFFFLKGDAKKATWEKMLSEEGSIHQWPANAVLQLGGSMLVSQW